MVFKNLTIPLFQTIILSIKWKDLFKKFFQSWKWHLLNWSSKVWVIKIWNSQVELENLYNNIATGVKIQSKCDWYQYNEKFNKYFLNLEKQKGVNGTVKKIIKNDIEINDQLKIQYRLRCFMNSYLKKLYAILILI